VRVNPSPVPVHTPTLHVGWFVAAVTVAVVVVLGVVLLPKYLLAWDLDGGPAPTDRAKAVNDIRTTLLQGLGGAALLVGAYFTWRQLQIAREGQLTERFTTAVGPFRCLAMMISATRSRSTFSSVLSSFQSSPLPFSAACRSRR